MSQDEQRSALGRRQADYQVAEDRQRLAEHERHLTRLRVAVTAVEQDLAEALGLLKSDPHLQIKELTEKVATHEAVLRELLR